MKVEEALEVLETVLPPGSLNAVKRKVFSQAWEGKAYSEIAEQAGYDPDYIKGVAANLWQSLSGVLDEKVTKKNFRALLRQKFGTHKSCLAKTELNIQQYIFQSSTETKKTLSKPKIDWGEAIDVSVFYGRSQELNQLQQYIIGDGCRLVALLGMGGIGKTAVAAKVAQQLQNEFDYIIWRSLRHAPSLETILTQLVSFLSQQECTQGELSKLIEYLRNSRCLIILDSVESILQTGCTGHYRPGYKDYSQLFHLIGETSHSSSLILTSREKPPEVAAFESIDAAVRSLQLLGSKEVAHALLKTNKILGSETQKQQLSEYYSYSPLALKIVTSSITDLFDGDLSEFLQHGTTTFNGIRRLLDQHFQRLSELEKKIIVWLAINQDWTNVKKLQTDIVPAISKANLLESLEALIWRSLVKKKSSMYTVEPVVMEYILHYLIEQVVAELTTANLDLFLSHSLIITTGKRYIKERQNKLIIEPIARQLSTIFSSTRALEQQLLLILNKLQASETSLCGYGIENLINLCMKLQIDLMVGDISPCQIESHKSANTCSQKAIEVLSTVNSKSSNYCTIVPGKLCPAISQADKQKCHESYDSQLLDRSSCVCPTNSVNLSDQTCLEPLKQEDENLLDCQVLLEKIQIPTLGNISVIASSPNKDFLAIADKLGEIRLLSMVNHQPHLVFEGHTQEIHSIVWSPDGNFLATGSSDRTVRLWDINTGKCLHIFEGHKARIDSLVWSQNNQTIASRSEDETIKLWDISTGECLHTWLAENFLQSSTNLDLLSTDMYEFLAPTFYEVECPVSLSINQLSFVGFVDSQFYCTPIVSFFAYKT
ncbi:MAG: NACHT domain-containing protein [Okeania sp. SIO2G4]|uniref:WD40 domain-containing protein n=1 Tax=unclassified Okeania TaxID=2634635 RepID=UPI0013B68AFB|nr:MULTISPECIES: NB-ARC domain-containing protein [unclassified Okeania]NEP72715.1 NACHT domain-containing protein [Okeania sp. SIO2G5]NEP93349.1 NACHT domain-containing protein [Okeania sp. SIO2F5]NEQ91361.1 NACHT domain-containing protein [Okeania sp. SIO2G4]